MRRLLLPFTVALLALACAAGATAAPLFVLQGSGWGHGVGMSQYGAQGKALNGAGYTDILGFYYQGTTLGSADKKKVRVLLASGRSSVTLSSSSSFTVGSKTLAAKTPYSVVPTAGGRVKIVGVGKFKSPATARPGSAFLKLNGARYRGLFKLWVRSGKIAVVNVVSLQDYLFSVVPREMPDSFELEALKAQSVAARSYAVRAHRDSWFDLYPDTRDQVYGGRDSEKPRSVEAVKATNGQVLFYGETVAQTYFSSSNGGRTATPVDSWGPNATNLPYLKTVKDPDDLNVANPNRSWHVTRTAKQMRSGLGLGRTPSDGTAAYNSSDRVQSVTMSGPGWTTVVPGWDSLRWRLGIRSTRFSLGVLSITPSRGKIVCGQKVQLDVIARHVANVTLQGRPATGGRWQALAMSDLGGGSFVAKHRPCVKTKYRLTSPVATGAKVAVRVRAAVNFTLEQPNCLCALTGVVKPKSLAGETVSVERYRPAYGDWRRVGSATVGSDGLWRAKVKVRGGKTYRARITPPAGSGLLPGVSPPLTVETG
jgi:stage II sporulation protein D